MNPVAFVSFFWLLILQLICSTAVSARELTMHYDRKNGLLSNVTYEGIFDREHYLWICTDHGLSRFNGTSFTHFTVREGLPDNDIIHVTEDRCGTIWVEPFQREAAFLEPGKTLFTNISTIIPRAMVQEDRTYRIFPLRDSSVALISEWNIRLVRNKKLIASYRLPQGISGRTGIIFRNDAGELVLLSSGYTGIIGPGGNTQVFSSPYCYEQLVQDQNLLWLQDHNTLVCLDLRRGRTGTPIDTITTPGKIHRFGFWGQGLLIETEGGTLFMAGRRGGKLTRSQKQYHIGYAASDSSRQVKAMFTTNDGIYVTVPTNSAFYTPLPRTPYYLMRQGNTVAILDAGHDYLYPGKHKGQPFLALHNAVSNEFAETAFGRTWVYGPRVAYIEAGQPPRFIKDLNSVKEVCCSGDSLRYIAAGNGAYLLNCRSRELRELYTGRCTAITAGAGGCIFIGTYTSLLQLSPEGIISDYLGAGFPGIRITDMIYDHNILWLATAGKGLYAIRDHRVQLALNQDSGLVSGDIEAIEADSAGNIFIGYATGGQRLSCRSDGNTIAVRELLTLHTPPGEGIRYLYFVHNKVYGIGNSGFFQFPARLPEAPKMFRSHIDRVIIDGKPTEQQNDYRLPPGRHDFSASFATINYEQFPVRYRYRNNMGAWVYSAEPYLHYHDLGPGTHTLEFQTLDNYGKASDSRTIRIDVQLPFYRNNWFLVTVSVLLLSGFSLVISLWHKFRHRKKRQSLLQGKRLKELELAALKAQITPHFVFNCLNSVKGLIYQQELESADKYIDRFAALFRNTLEASARPYHSLRQELDYIRNYLLLEQSNLDNGFSCNVSVTPGADTDKILLPPMLLQPYIENAVKHGMRRLPLKQGHIQVLFDIKGERLRCRVMDNGPGRANTLNQRTHQGQGMLISARRAQLYDILTEIRDNSPSGTIVILSLPLKLNDKKTADL